MNAVDHRVVYLSPAGTTRRVADTIAGALRSRGQSVQTWDLEQARGSHAIALAGPTCVWVGSPVYAHHPIPQVLAFVHRLPVLRHGFGVPFVTWGAVTSGLALWDLGVGLEARGYRILGAAKVLAAHSIFWNAPEPLGAGHPNAEDLGLVETLVDGVLEKMAAGGPPLGPEPLDYQPPAVRAVSEGLSIERAKGRMPARQALEEKCTQCGVCRDVCPVGAVDLTPYPVFHPECVLCNECVRACPEDAIPFDPGPWRTHIRQMAERFGEEPVTRVFL